MHGRVRVRGTEEQEQLRKEKKQQAVRKLQGLLDSIFAARSEKKYTTNELGLIESAVDDHSDVVTLWNYRREILSHLLMSSDSSQDISTSLLNHELTLTAQCLFKNPKSYCLWHHRMWAMKSHPDASWKDEILFCNEMLRKDERNFHCWDYRRFVVCKGHIPVAKELSYTENEIESNMSNYSAWHYRGELLSSLDPSFESTLPFSPPPDKTDDIFTTFSQSSMLSDELVFVHNALYTDPNDQSPWRYYWFLLGRGNKRAYLREIFISRSLERIVIVFTSAKSYSSVHQLDVCIRVSYPDGELREFAPRDLGDWQSALGDRVSAVWWLGISPDRFTRSASEGTRCSLEFTQLKLDVSVCIRQNDGSSQSNTRRDPRCPPSHLFCFSCQLNEGQNESLTRVDLDPLRLLNRIVSPINEPEDLQTELQTISELVSLAPNNAWALQTYIHLLRFVRPSGYLEDAESAMDTLLKIDKRRVPFYLDLKSRHGVQDALASTCATHSRELSLKRLGLRDLPYSDWCTLMTKIDLSGNYFVELPSTLSYLVCLFELIMDDNLLTTLNGINHLPSLQILSVKRNRLLDFASITDLLSCPKVKNVYIDGNKVTELPDFTALLAEHPSLIVRKHSFVVTYDRRLAS